MDKLEEFLKRNKQAYMNFGFIAYGPLEEIEKLQRLVSVECEKLKVIYQTVSARRLWLVRKKEER